MSQRPRFLTTVDWRPYMDGAEDNIRDETLRCMLQYGIRNVRGWRYIGGDLSVA
jgi:CII-binding regulator of phage lambda lysogenization HflD